MQNNSYKTRATAIGGRAGLSQDDAEKLVAATYKICPYSNATCRNVNVRLHTTVV